MLSNKNLRPDLKIECQSIRKFIFQIKYILIQYCLSRDYSISDTKFVFLIITGSYDKIYRGHQFWFAVKLLFKELPPIYDTPLFLLTRRVSQFRRIGTEGLTNNI